MFFKATLIFPLTDLFAWKNFVFSFPLSFGVQNFRRTVFTRSLSWENSTNLEKLSDSGNSWDALTGILPVEEDLLYLKTF